MNEVIIDIYSVIDNYGYLTSNVRYQLARNKGKKVRCRVNSLGGSVDQALTISQLLAEHGDVVVEFVGLCASAATWMAFGAKSIEMHEDSLLLCHKCSTTVDVYASLNADKIEAMIDDLKNKKQNIEALDLLIAKKYLDKCKSKGKNLQDVLNLMKAANWMTNEQALEWGFVDKIIPGINRQVTNEMRDLMAQNCAALDLTAPPFEVQQVNAVDNKDNDMVARIINGIKQIFKPIEDENKKETVINQNQKVMNKDFTTINSLLGVEGFEAKDQKVDGLADPDNVIPFGNIYHIFARGLFHFNLFDFDADNAVDFQLAADRSVFYLDSVFVSADFYGLNICLLYQMHGRFRFLSLRRNRKTCR